MADRSRFSDESDPGRSDLTFADIETVLDGHLINFWKYVFLIQQGYL